MPLQKLVPLAALFVASFAFGSHALAEYDVPERSDAEVETDLAATCASAVAKRQPMLLEFSAPWCSDCQRLQQMKQANALADELERWPKLVVNVGHFDLHRALLAAFGVKNIAHWAVISPSDCATAPETWPRLAERKLEPESGAERTVSPADLAAWLEALRRP